jgi:protein gp37
MSQRTKIEWTEITWNPPPRGWCPSFAIYQHNIERRIQNGTK